MQCQCSVIDADLFDICRLLSLYCHLSTKAGCIVFCLVLHYLVVCNCIDCISSWLVVFKNVLHLMCVCHFWSET